MCGIAGSFGGPQGGSQAAVRAMMDAISHRGPDGEGLYADPDRPAAFGQKRLSILDLSAAGRNPMWDHTGNRSVVFNGEIYNYLELRQELAGYPFRSQTDTEVILAAYERWGEACLDRFTGMFAFLLWDRSEGRLFAARDRFGVKPLYYHLHPDGTLLLASEIKALHAAQVPARPDAGAWATYLKRGLHENTEGTFWEEVQTLPPGHLLRWRDTGQSGKAAVSISRWYDVAERSGTEFDSRPEEAVEEEYLSLLETSVRLRFRSDVPVGINLSGGLDSSLLLGLVQKVRGEDSETMAFTFTTGDPAYDELPWVEQMVRHTKHPLTECRLRPEEVPALAASVAAHQDEPFGGLPTLAYAALFQKARETGVIVLLDGQGLDEQWGGYDYYVDALEGRSAGLVQGLTDRPVRPECLRGDFLEMAKPWDAPRPFPDALRNAQYRDARYTKIPRALRFNDRVSMRASTELREPFLDHSLFELALRQPADRKIAGGTRKRLLRRIASRLLPAGVVEAPKRPLQTPQREWLRGPLRAWADERIEDALERFGGSWLDAEKTRSVWREYQAGAGENSFYVWQWIGLGQLAARLGR